MNGNLILAAFCLMACGTASIHANPDEKKTVSVAELNSERTVVGALGKPVFKVRKVTGRFVAGSASKRNGEANICLEVTHVDDLALTAPVKVDFSPWNAFQTLPTGERISYSGAEERAALLGKPVSCLGYEDVQTEGVPQEIRKYVEADSKQGPQFYSILIIVKVLDGGGK